MTTRKFKRVNLLGLDFYVDWIEETGEFIAIKEVHSGKRFVYNGLVNADGVSLEDMFRSACGIAMPVKEEPKIEEEVKEEIEEVAPAALETEQPKEEPDEKPKKRNKRSKE